jgi:hypothetical protein
MVYGEQCQGPEVDLLALYSLAEVTFTEVEIDCYCTRLN